MNGTWKVTGLGLGPVVLVVVAAVAAAEGVAWILARIWWILGTGVLCAVLMAVALAWLIRWQDRNAARVWSQRPAQLHAARVTEIPRAQPAAIEQHIHYHYHQAPAPEVTVSSPVQTILPPSASHGYVRAADDRPAP